MTGKRLDQHCAILLAVMLLNAGGIDCYAQGDEPPSAELPINAVAPEAVSGKPEEVLINSTGETQPQGQPGEGGFSGIGFGGGGFGGGRLGLPESAIPGKRYTEGQTLVIAIADDDSQIFGYSDRHPRWAPSQVPKIEGAELVPIVGFDVAAVMFGNVCFAYSPALGTWDQLTLPVGEGAQPVVGSGIVSIHSPTKGDFVFKNDWGKWFSAEEIKVGAVARHLAERGEPDSAGMVLKMFHLKNIQAVATAKLLVQLYGADDISIIPEEGRNSLLVRGATDRLAEIEAVLLKLDADESATANPADSSNTGMPIDSRDVKMGLSARSESAAELRARYEDLERHMSALAATLRAAGAKRGVDRVNQLPLVTLVEKAFDARQRLQRAEIAGFAERLRGLQQSLETREKLRDQIVKRRVDELLNPGLKWEETAAPEGTNAQTLGAGTSSTDTTSQQSPEDSALFQVTVRDENGLARVRFQPSPHSTLEQLKIGQRVMVSQTLRPIKAGFDHTPIILEDAVLLDFWQDRRRAASNQPVTLQVRGQDMPGLIEAAKRGALEVHAAPPHAMSDSSGQQSSADMMPNGGMGVTGAAAPVGSVRLFLRHSGTLQDCIARRIFGLGNLDHLLPNLVQIDSPHGSATTWYLRNLNHDPKKELILILDVPKSPEKLPQGGPPIMHTLTDEDFSQALAGNRVTKVIYIPRNLERGEETYQTVVNTRLDPAEDPVKVAEQRGTVVAAIRLQRDLAVSESSPLSSRQPKRDAPLLATAFVEDPPYEPKSELEKSVAKLVLTFFQDQSRLAVPCLVVNIGDVTYAVSSGTVNLVPKDLPPAIDATHLEWAGSPAPIPAVYDSRSTKEFFLYRVRDNLKAPELTETWKVSRGDRLSTLYRDSLTTLREIPVQVTELDVGQDYFTPPGRTIPHQYRGLFHVDRRVPEGTLLFHEGKLAGMTLLGANYSENNGSYVVPANRLLSLLRELDTETEEDPGTTAPGKQPSSE